jgi:hypothetical protein
MSDETPAPFAGLPCIKCGECDTITLDLADLDSFSCQSCDATFDNAEVQAVLDVWPAVLNWIDLAKSQKEA